MQEIMEGEGLEQVAMADAAIHEDSRLPYIPSRERG